MFRCQRCGKIVPPRTRSHRVTIETRHKQYSPVERASKDRRRGGFRGRGPGGPGGRGPGRTFDKGGEGFEIANELIVCPKCAEECAEEHLQQQAQERAELARKQEVEASQQGESE